MTKVLGFTVALVLALSVVGAWAAGVEGKIEQVDLSDRVIVLDDGTKPWIAEGLQMYSLQEGAEVRASYEERDGKQVVTQVEVLTQNEVE